MKFDIKDKKLAAMGAARIEWAGRDMPVLADIAKDFAKSKPLKGIKVAACLHVTSETANLMKTLKAGGADVLLCASNPLSTQDDVAASLVVNDGIPVFAIKGEDHDTYYSHIRAVLETKPQITMDDGADLVSMLHSDLKSLLPHVIGGTEETTTGVIRLKAMAKNKVLGYPIVAVNDSETKHLFDNRYGTGQSTLDGIMRATNRLFAGSTVVVCGYGWCGRGIARRASGMGAKVIVTEIDPIKGLEAAMDGFGVMPIREAAKVGDFFITVTGDINVIAKEAFKVMKDGAIVCNSGHFNAEIDIPALEKLSVKKNPLRDFVEEYVMKDGRRIMLLGEGRLINLASAEGHPAQVMDMSFANQALGAEYIVKHARTLPKDVLTIPKDVDREIARRKLAALGIGIDILTPEQERYLASWEQGT
ncbi:MAG: adenosylhomocysteinase [Nitrospiraceae bacterium]|nr:adenosylhomocysteinase [Nitrospiraceae bacterium]